VWIAVSLTFDISVVPALYTVRCCCI